MKQNFYQGIEALKLFLSSAADRAQTEVNGWLENYTLMLCGVG